MTWFLEGRCTALVLSLVSVLLWNSKVAAEPERAKSADAFIDMMGVNGHLNFEGSVYMNHFADRILPRAKELGIRHWRDALNPSDTVMNRQFLLGQMGILFNLSVSVLDTGDMMATVKRVLPVLDAVEGPNELDHGFRNGLPAYPDHSTRVYKGLSFPAIVPAIQNDIYAAIKGNPATKHLQVVMAGFSFPDNTVDVGIVSGCDCGNIHSYPDGGPPTYRLDDWYIPRMKANSGPTKPLCATETGYHNSLAPDVSHWIAGTSERAASKYMLRIFFEYMNRGFHRAFLYEFIDGAPDGASAEGHFGLVHYDGTPKEQFTAVKNLISMLGDMGPDFSPGTLDYTLSGNTTLLNHTLLQKRDGTFYLALWLNVSSYNKNTKTDIDEKRNIQVTFNTPVNKLALGYPRNSAVFSADVVVTPAMNVEVTDHPVLLRITPKTLIVPPVGLFSNKSRQTNQTQMHGQRNSKGLEIQMKEGMIRRANGRLDRPSR